MSSAVRSGLASAMALAFGACAPEEGPTEPESLSGSVTAASDAYAPHDLGTLGGSYSFAFGISPLGDVVGTSATAGGTDHAFLWRNGIMTDLGTLAGGSGTSAARAVNRHGEVVGSSTTPDGQDRAFLWREGVMIDLGTIDGSGNSSAYGINRRSQVVGSSASATSDQHAFLWENGVMTNLGTLGGPWSQANDINNPGQVVGVSRVDFEDDNVHHAFLWQNGVMTDLGTLGGRTSVAQGINNAGDIVGYSEAADGTTHAVMWKDGQIIDLGLYRGSNTVAYAINSDGVRVGFAQGPLFWRRDTARRLATIGGGPGGDAVDINDAGQIVGSSNTVAGDRHATLWTPN